MFFLDEMAIRCETCCYLKTCTFKTYLLSLLS
nr:MAG TPA: hypothetical protein [Caudoviricetes sp.]DAS52244.1 MAG TPA: hypothetical protein [Caudoviricetes sp.]